MLNTIIYSGPYSSHLFIDFKVRITTGLNVIYNQGPTGIYKVISVDKDIVVLQDPITLNKYYAYFDELLVVDLDVFHLAIDPIIDHVLNTKYHCAN